MKYSEIKELLIASLNADADPEEFSGKMEEAGISYNFSRGFADKILDRLFPAGVVIEREIEFVKSMNFAFYRIAVSGAVAIMVLLISIYFMQGSLSLDSFLGLSDSYDESIICLLTGK